MVTMVSFEYVPIKGSDQVCILNKDLSCPKKQFFLASFTSLLTLMGNIIRVWSRSASCIFRDGLLFQPALEICIDNPW